MSTQKVSISLGGSRSFNKVPVKKVLGLKTTYNISFPGPSNRNTKPLRDHSVCKFSVMVSPSTQGNFINAVLDWYDSLNGYDGSFKMKNYARDYLLARNKRVKTVKLHIEGSVGRTYKFKNVFPCSWIIENFNEDNENLIKIEFCYDSFEEVVSGRSGIIDDSKVIVKPQTEDLDLNINLN